MENNYINEGFDKIVKQMEQIQYNYEIMLEMNK